MLALRASDSDFTVGCEEPSAGLHPRALLDKRAHAYEAKNRMLWSRQAYGNPCKFKGIGY